MARATQSTSRATRKSYFRMARNPCTQPRALPTPSQTKVFARPGRRDPPGSRLKGGAPRQAPDAGCDQSRDAQCFRARSPCRSSAQSSPATRQPTRLRCDRHKACSRRLPGRRSRPESRFRGTADRRKLRPACEAGVHSSAVCEISGTSTQRDAASPRPVEFPVATFRADCAWVSVKTTDLDAVDYTKPSPIIQTTTSRRRNNETSAGAPFVQSMIFSRRSSSRRAARKSRQ